MKRILIGVSALVFVLSLTAPAMAVSPTPSQCSGMTFDHVITNNDYGVVINGTGGRDLIFANGGDVIRGNGGNDCIVTSQGGNSIDAGSGNDVVVAEGTGNSVLGGSGNDNLTVVDNTSFINGGTGHNVCVGTDAVKNCN